MKRTKTNTKDRFTASNGVTFEYAPEPDAPAPFTQTQLKKVKPVSAKEAGISPELLAAAKELRQTRGRGRPKAENPKKPISFRFSADLVNHLKNEVEGYNVRVEHLLHQAMIEGRL